MNNDHAKTTNSDFSDELHLLSDKPIRRTRPRLTSEYMRKLAKQNPPPQSWYEGDVEKPF